MPNATKRLARRYSRACISDRVCGGEKPQDVQPFAARCVLLQMHERQGAKRRRHRLGVLPLPANVQVQGIKAMTQIDDLIDECWGSMRPSLMRRAVLGKKRCAQLVLMALANFPDRELVGATPGSAYEKKQKQTLAARVEANYRKDAPPTHGTYGAVFLSIVLAWAIRAIVEYLIDQWLKNHFSMDDIRHQYGWK